MPSRRAVFDKTIRDYRTHCEERRLTSSHRYELIIRRFAKFQVAHGREYLPGRVKREDLHKWRIELEATTSIANTRWCLSVVNGWLRFHKNAEAQLTGVRWPHAEFVNATWLTVDQKLALELHAPQPLRWILHCGVRLGLRREEWANLKLDDVRADCVVVFGKGEKTATVPTLSRTADEFAQICRWREEQLVRGGHCATRAILLVRYGRRWKEPSLTSADFAVAQLSELMQALGGPRFTSHDLRRTCARHLWLSGVPLDHIRRFLRHEELATTLRYIGPAFEATATAVRAAELKELEVR